MPYIKPEDKERFPHAFMANLAEEIQHAGDLNYVLSTICGLYLERLGLRYANVNEIIGAVECVKLEMYRRVAAPYEDAKIAENGDVYPEGTIYEDPR